jgi:peroxiredoxin/mono/diheme cytochrome c family protein
MRWIFMFAVVCGWLTVATVTAAPPASGKVTPEVAAVTLTDFQLVDRHGRDWTLADFQDDAILVLAFLGTECPLAQHYAVRLQQIADQYRDRGVAVIGVMSNRQDSLEEIAAYASRQQIQFPVLKDAGNQLADQVGATRTPEIFVFAADRTLRYQGRVDDQYGIGLIRDHANRHDLAVALDELLAGNEVSVPRTTAPGCLIGRARTVDPNSAVTYGSEIVKILNERCVECHRAGEIAPFALTDYDEVAGWAEMIAEVVRDGRMPPWHATDQHAEFSNDRRLSEAEREAIFAWADAGAPAGDLTQLPPLPAKVEGWRLPQEPDLVFPISKVPFQVPATGTVDYQFFSVDPNFTEDVWIKAFEIIPGNREVVHHVLGFAVDKGQSAVALQAAQGFKFGYVPGTRFTTAPPGHAIRIPAGSDLLFQIHYVSTGEPESDQSSLGLVLADPSEVTHELLVGSAFTVDIRIPPHESNYVVHAASPAFPPDSTLLSMNPHMHFRGKSMRLALETPTGDQQTLLDVPNYDFNWQTLYVLADPIPVPTGSRMICDAVFDNSAENLSNPDPSKWVYFGDQTWNEMMIGYYFFSVPVGPTESGLTRSEIFKQNQMRSTLLSIFEKFDDDQDGRIAKRDLSGPMSLAYAGFDGDGDGIVTRQEVSEGKIPVLMEIILANLMR